MDVVRAISVLNQLEVEGVIGRYAIGGAFAANFYLEVRPTEDVDIFFRMEATFDPLQKFWDRLKSLGFGGEGVYAVIAGVKIQCLPPQTQLEEEALRDAVEKEFAGIRVRVFTAEHLAAIALRLSRPQDRIRLVQFVEERAIDEAVFHAILERFQLLERWVSFRKKFVD